jgi:hypothetical protein
MTHKTCGADAEVAVAAFARELTVRKVTFCNSQSEMVVEGPQLSPGGPKERSPWTPE